MTARGTPTLPAVGLWRSADLPHTDSFAYDLDPDELGVLTDAAQRIHAEGRNVEKIVSDELPLGPLRPRIDELRRELMQGRGLVLLRGFPVDRFPRGVVELLFWGVGLGLGTAVSQSVMGERLGHVVDVTAEDPHARAYRNRSELIPHSDPADILSFLCLHPARSGGVSRFVNALAIHEALRRERPDALDLLYRGFSYHRVGEQGPEDPPITPHRVPVFSQCGGQVSCRLIRQLIDIAADEDPGLSPTAAEREALDLIEAHAAHPDFSVEFTLGPGEAIFANNFTTLHARSAFEDYSELEKKRHLLRLWLSAHPPRPVLPEIEIWEGEPGIPAQPGRAPSYAGISKYDLEHALSPEESRDRG